PTYATSSKTCHCAKLLTTTNACCHFEWRGGKSRRLHHKCFRLLLHILTADCKVKAESAFPRGILNMTSQLGPNLDDIILRLDHVVLTVRDLEVTAAFYEKNLGMRRSEFDGRLALHFGDQKINLHHVDDYFKLNAEQPLPGAGDLCFITKMAVQTL